MGQKQRRPEQRCTSRQAFWQELICLPLLLPRSIGEWTLVSIPGIKVANGQCQIAISSDAKANNWVQVDDISLVNNAATSVVNASVLSARN